MSDKKSRNNKKNTASNVEARALAASQFEDIYRPEEKMPSIIVDNFPTLGKLAALRFLEWVQQNPGGVISLPTGKTPEHFIKWVRHLLGSWEKSETQAMLEEVGIDPAVKPDMKSLHFVQIDEFYPISPKQTNSFYSYVKQFYINGFGLDRKKAMLIDCSKIALAPDEKLEDIWPDSTVDLALRYTQPKNHLQAKQKSVLQKIDQWCMEYEDRICKLGGIGFFLGGIGPDGHIGFNISGSDHYSTTRLCPINYETQAAAATDLGGIEIAKKSLVITIGLKTITRNSDGTAIIIAAGASKATVVADAIQSDHDINIPATALHELPNARFYLTHGAAANLVRRRLHVLDSSEEYAQEQIETILMDLAVANNKKLTDLEPADCKASVFGQQLLEKYPDKLKEFAKSARDNIIAKIECGIKTSENKNFLHTEPHHDDVMLGYFARLVRHSRQVTNNHYFTTLTSGSNPGL
jgi:glucosamine-6-phosphate deaminase